MKVLAGIAKKRGSKYRFQLCLRATTSPFENSTGRVLTGGVSGCPSSEAWGSSSTSTTLSVWGETTRRIMLRARGRVPAFCFVLVVIMVIQQGFCKIAHGLCRGVYFFTLHQIAEAFFAICNHSLWHSLALPSCQLLALKESHLSNHISWITPLITSSEIIFGFVFELLVYSTACIYFLCLIITWLAFCNSKILRMYRHHLDRHLYLFVISLYPYVHLLLDFFRLILM